MPAAAIADAPLPLLRAAEVAGQEVAAPANAAPAPDAPPLFGVEVEFASERSIQPDASKNTGQYVRLLGIV
ncbi:MAG: hypothetical protein HY748_03960 [Elusimicrobia bacterium]|nr:hypothetical protein [Elusimicrobiota bacterium]